MKDKQICTMDLANRLPFELLPKKPTWPKLLSAVTKLKIERNRAEYELINAKARIKQFETALNAMAQYSDWEFLVSLDHVELINLLLEEIKAD